MSSRRWRSLKHVPEDTASEDVIRELMRRAYLRIGGGAGTQAVALLCRALLVALESRPQLLQDASDGLSISALDWPAIGANLSVIEGKPRIEYAKQKFSPLEAATYYRFLQHLIVGSRPTPSITRTKQRVMAWLLRLDARVMEALPVNVSPALKRLMLYCFNEIRFLLTSKTRYGRVFIYGSAEAISTMLGEPMGRAVQLLKESFLQMALLSSNTYSPRRTAQFKERFRESFVWRDEARYVEFIRDDKRSRVLTTLHLGSFWTASTRIASHSEPGRRSIFLRYRDPTESEAQAFQEFSSVGAAHDIVRNHEHNPLNTLRQLRKGDTTLSPLFDLHSRYGETIDVKFFGRHARFVKGPAELAIVGRAPIIPWVTYNDGGTNIIEMHDVIETGLLPGETLEQAVRRITQQLVTMAEGYIRAYPEQWFFLQDSAKYFLGKNGLLVNDFHR